MLTNGIFVRKDWTTVTQEMERDRRRITIVGAVVMILATAGVLVTLSQRMDKGLESFISEALSLGLFLAVPVWYALRHRADGLRKAVAVYLLFLVVMLINDWVIKRGLDSELVNSALANDPLLYVSISMLLIWLIPLWLIRAHPAQAHSIGLASRRAGRQILHGSLGAIILILHLWTTLRYSGLSLSLKPLPYVVFTLCYEVTAQSLSEELFFRGFLFNYYHCVSRGRLWRTAILVSLLNALFHAVKFRTPSNPYELFGSAFYAFVMAMINAILYRRWGGILPGLVLNVLFSMGLLLR